MYQRQSLNTCRIRYQRMRGRIKDVFLACVIYRDSNWVTFLNRQLHNDPNILT